MDTKVHWMRCSEDDLEDGLCGNVEDTPQQGPSEGNPPLAVFYDPEAVACSPMSFDYGSCAYPSGEDASMIGPDLVGLLCGWGSEIHYYSTTIWDTSTKMWTDTLKMCLDAYTCPNVFDPNWDWGDPNEFGTPAYYCKENIDSSQVGPYQLCANAQSELSFIRYFMGFYNPATRTDAREYFTTRECSWGAEAKVYGWQPNQGPAAENSCPRPWGGYTNLRGCPRVEENCGEDTCWHIPGGCPNQGEHLRMLILKQV